MIGSVPASIAAVTGGVSYSEMNYEQETDFATSGSLSELVEADVVIGELADFTETTARIMETMAQIAWRETPEGLAWQQEQIELQNAQPVDLAIYQNGELTAFKTASGFQSTNGLASILPDNWDTMSLDALEDALATELWQRGIGGFEIITSTEGLTMTAGQANEEFNQKT